MSDQLRQGHILLVPHPIPTGAAIVPPAIPGHVVIGVGETGREHVFESQRVEIFKDGTDLYIEVKDAPVWLTHPEHGDIEVPEGSFKLVEQREDAPATAGRPRRSPD